MDMGFFLMHRLMFTLVPVLMIVLISANLIQGFRQWNRDNHSPRLTVEASVVAKRTEFRSRRHNRHTMRNSRYYATFQFGSGDRLELELEGGQYGLLVEGDRGELTFQGSRFLEFQRT